MIDPEHHESKFSDLNEIRKNTDWIGSNPYVTSGLWCTLIHDGHENFEGKKRAYLNFCGEFFFFLTKHSKNESPAFNFCNL